MIQVEAQKIWEKSSELDAQYVLDLLSETKSSIDVLVNFAKKDTLHLGPDVQRMIEQVIRKNGARLIPQSSSSTEDGYHILIKSHVFISLKLQTKEPV